MVRGNRAAGSRVILRGSINARIGAPTSSVYVASKAALISMARTLSGELIGRGIRVNAISPGPISTSLYSRLGLTDSALAAMKSDLLRQIPSGQFGQPSDIANAAVYFASDESRFVVGSELVVDGGMSNV